MEEKEHDGVVLGEGCELRVVMVATVFECVTIEVYHTRPRSHRRQDLPYQQGYRVVRERSGEGFA